jgi:uncharacterized protein
MIIDGHMHIGREDLLDSQITAFLKSRGAWEEVKSKISPEGVIGALDEAGIDRGVIFPLTFAPTDGSWQALNDLTASYVQRYPERLVGFSIIDPRHVPDTLRELERAFDQLGLMGVKLHPSMQEFYPNDASLDPIFAFIEARGLPVIVHTGASAAGHPDIYSRPMLLDEVACKHPDLKLILAHAGRPFYAEAALLIRKYPNVYADICANVGRKNREALLAYVLLSLNVYAGAGDRLIFGSDFPVFSPAQFLQQFRLAAADAWAERWGLDSLSMAEHSCILGGNMSKLLNLQ